MAKLDTRQHPAHDNKSETDSRHKPASGVRSTKDAAANLAQLRRQMTGAQNQQDLSRRSMRPSREPVTANANSAQNNNRMSGAAAGTQQQDQRAQVSSVSNGVAPLQGVTDVICANGPKSALEFNLRDEGLGDTGVAAAVRFVQSGARCCAE